MRTVKIFGLLAVLLLAFNLVVMPFWWGGNAVSEGPLHLAQLAILLGFLYVFLFDLASAAFVLTRICWLVDGEGEEGCQKGWLLVLATLALVGMAGAKVMVDEIGRETILGIGAEGEWAVLYVCLGLQMAYLLAILVQRDRPTTTTRS
jgi:hypothetical protein